MSLQLEEMPRVPVVSFPLFTRERFTGDAQLKMQSRNGVLSLKCLISKESGVTANGEKGILPPFSSLYPNSVQIIFQTTFLSS